MLHILYIIQCGVAEGVGICHQLFTFFHQSYLKLQFTFPSENLSLAPIDGQPSSTVRKLHPPQQSCLGKPKGSIHTTNKE